MEDAINSANATIGEPPLLRRLTASQYLRNNILLLAANVMTGVFAYLLHPTLGHLMGVTEYGVVASLIALSAVLLTPLQITATVMSKFAASLSTTQSYGELNDLIRRLTGILLPVGLCVTVIFIAVSGFVSSFFHLRSSDGVLLLGLIFLVAFASPVNLGTIGGLQRFGWYAVITLLPLLMRLILAAAFVLAGLGVNGAVLGIVLSAIVAYIVSFQPLRPILSGPRVPLGSLRSVWSYSFIALAASMATVLLYNMDTVLAKHFLLSHDAGLYAALATIGRTVIFVSSSVTIVMFPRVASLHERGESHSRVMFQALFGVLALSAAVEAVFIAAPAGVIRVLFGSVFSSVSDQIAWYGLAMLLLALAQVLGSYFLAIGNRTFVLIFLACCALQVILIAMHHGSIAQLVQAVVISNAALVAALLVAFTLHMYRSHRPGARRQARM